MSTYMYILMIVLFPIKPDRFGDLTRETMEWEGGPIVTQLSAVLIMKLQFNKTRDNGGVRLIEQIIIIDRRIEIEETHHIL